MENAKWISCPPECDSPVIRRLFSLSAPTGGSIRITGLGFFTLFINGKRVGGDLFTPALTDYEPRDMSRWSYPLFDITTHRILYLRYDVGDFLQDGENVLEVQLGPGWYRQNERLAEGRMSFGSELKAWFEAEFSQSDGNTVRVFSDGTEQWRASSIVYSNLFAGEVIDARVSEREAVYSPVKTVPAPDAILEEQTCPSDRVIRTIVPVLHHTLGSRRFYDAGESISGRVRVTAGGEPGRKITLRFADEFYPDGELNFDSTGGRSRFADGRYQIQSDTFICGSGKTVFAPEYAWHAFRYFEIDGEFDELAVEVIHTDVPVISSFDSSSPILNWLYDAYVRTQLDNLHNCIPSDCPHRERLGYTGDGQLAAKAAMFALDMRGVYRKWIRDILDCQDVISGHVQHTAPAMGGGGGPGGWGCAVVIVPDEYFRHYGDREILEECYPHMVRWIAYLKSHSVSGLVVREEERGWCLGDWASLHPLHIPAAYVNSCFLLDSLYRMVRISRELGHSEDSRNFAEYAKLVRKAIVSEYFDAATGSYAGGVQGADAYAVWVGLDEDGRAFKNLVDKYRRLDYFDTGFIGTEILVNVLTGSGEANLAYQLMTSEKLGSYAYMKEHGATTIWEDFDGRESHNHPMYGSPVRHLFDAFLGIRQPEGENAYRRLVIAPQIPDRLSFASGSTVLPCGPVSVSFSQDGKTVSFRVSVPDGVPAEFTFGGKTLTLLPGENSFSMDFKA